MRTLFTLLLLFETLVCFSQDPKITFGGLKDSIVTKDQLLLNDGVVFSNDSTDNISCLMTVDFSFSIVKLSGDTLVIETNNCPNKVNNRREARMMKRFDKGKSFNMYAKSRCRGIDRFNSTQLKAIKKMKPGESILIDRVNTRASSCSCLGRWWKAGLKYTIR
jgi:hypothetical protein